MIQIFNLIVRALQILFAIVVLGLSASAIDWQHYGSAPASSGYAAFAGAFGLIAALVGLAAVWITAISGMIMIAIDALSGLLLLAGAIAFAVGLSGVKCKENATNSPAANNGLLNGGCHQVNGQTQCGYKDGNSLTNRCQHIEADTAFLFLGFLASIVGAVLSFLVARRGKTTSSKPSNV